MIEGYNSPGRFICETKKTLDIAEEIRCERKNVSCIVNEVKCQKTRVHKIVDEIRCESKEVLSIVDRRYGATGMQLSKVNDNTVPTTTTNITHSCNGSNVADKQQRSSFLCGESIYGAPVDKVSCCRVGVVSHHGDPSTTPCCCCCCRYIFHHCTPAVTSSGATGGELTPPPPHCSLRKTFDTGARRARAHPTHPSTPVPHPPPPPTTCWEETTSCGERLYACRNARVSAPASSAATAFGDSTDYVAKGRYHYSTSTSSLGLPAPVLAAHSAMGDSVSSRNSLSSGSIRCSHLPDVAVPIGTRSSCTHSDTYRDSTLSTAVSDSCQLSQSNHCLVSDCLRHQQSQQQSVSEISLQPPQLHQSTFEDHFFSKSDIVLNSTPLSSTSTTSVITTPPSLETPSISCETAPVSERTSSMVTEEIKGQFLPKRGLSGMSSCDQCMASCATGAPKSSLCWPHSFLRSASTCSRMGHQTTSSTRWRSPSLQGLYRGALVLALILSVFVSPSSAGNGHTITAFEYQRKFNKPLDLGECPQRKVAVKTNDNQIVVESQRCTLHKAGIVQHMPRELNDSRNVIIQSPYGIVHYLGLCGGEAASFLGILVSGDCVAVEIASRLTFNEKTLIRAFVGVYRKSLDVLDSKGNITNGMVRYYKDKFYLKNRSYGTMDLVIVQFRFKNSRLKEKAKNIQLASTRMSDYMKAIEQMLGRPRGVTVINLSTATSASYNIARFKADNWDRALRHVQVVEDKMWNLQQDITNDHLLPQPHLKYRLFPFVDSENGSLRNTKPLSWEKISMLEVQLRHSIGVARKTAKKCRGNKSSPCRRVRGLRRELFATYREIHQGRSEWVDLSKEDKMNFATNYTTTVNTLSSVTKTLAQKVRRARRLAKLDALADKHKKSRNQIPNSVPRRGRSRSRKHSIRHARRKNRARRMRMRGRMTRVPTN